VGQELGKYYLRDELAPRAPHSSVDLHGTDANGSCMIVVATDAPLDARDLKRLAARAIMGLARTGSSGANGSGDFVIAFSTAPALRPRAGELDRVRQIAVLGNEAMSPLFEAVIESTEEAIINSLFKATRITGQGHSVEALPIDKTVQILREHKIIQ
jgi:D-aminopeptidase